MRGIAMKTGSHLWIFQGLLIRIPIRKTTKSPLNSTVMRCGYISDINYAPPGKSWSQYEGRQAPDHSACRCVRAPSPPQTTAGSALSNAMDAQTRQNGGAMRMRRTTAVALLMYLVCMQPAPAVATGQAAARTVLGYYVSYDSSSWASLAHHID